MRRPSEASKWGFVPVVILATVIFFASGIAPFVRGFFADIIVHRDNDPYAGLSRSELVSRLIDDENKLARVNYQAALYESIVKENEELKSVSHVVGFSKAAPAKVLARPPQTGYDTLLIDSGSASGVHVNDLAVYNGVLVGYVAAVGPTSSTIRLYTSPGATHDVVLGTPQAVAVINGVGGGAYELKIPKSVTVAAGDAVRVPHSEDLLMGVVASFTSTPTDATQTVYVRTPVSMYDLTYISIIPENQTP